MRFAKDYPITVEVSEQKAKAGSRSNRKIELTFDKKWWQFRRVYVKHGQSELAISPLPKTGYDKVDLQKNGRVVLANKSPAPLVDRSKTKLVLDEKRGDYTVKLRAAA